MADIKLNSIEQCNTFVSMISIIFFTVINTFRTRFGA